MADSNRIEGTLKRHVGPPRLAGLIGQAGSGKDLVASHLRMVDYQRFGFADQVRKEIWEAYGLHRSFPKGAPVDLSSAKHIWEKPLPTPTRKLLQWWGTEYRRREDSRYWIKKLQPIVEDLLLRGGLIVISDVRFLNEAEWIRELNGEIWFVNRRGLTEDSHQSEQEYKQIRFDQEIDNNGDLQYLAEGIIKCLNHN